jgi:internalin A
MAIVLLLGGGLSWICQRARVQHKAVAAIVRAGGRVTYDNRAWPGWFESLVDHIGPDYFASVVSVSLMDRGSDEILLHVGCLDRLTFLDLSGRSEDSRGYVHDTGSSVSDVGLVHLKGLTRLEHLILCNTRVSAAGLAQLNGLANLRDLSLGHTPIGDSDLSTLEGMTGLSELELVGTKVTDAGLSRLMKLTNLRVLMIADTRVGDAGLKHLKGLTSHNTIWLYDTGVSDAGLMHLKGLTGLRELYVGRTNVSDAGRAELRNASPKLKISRDEP